MFQTPRVRKQKLIVGGGRKEKHFNATLKGCEILQGKSIWSFFFFFVILDQNVHFGNEIQKVMMSSKVLQFNVLQGLSLESHKTFK